MKCHDAPPPQNKPHHWTAKVDREIVHGERRQTGSPKAFRTTIHKEACLIAIVQFEKQSCTERGKGERRIFSSDFSKPRVLQVRR
jgi:hypothetical protein